MRQARTKTGGRLTKKLKITEGWGTFTRATSGDTHLAVDSLLADHPDLSACRYDVVPVRLTPQALS